MSFFSTLMHGEPSLARSRRPQEDNRVLLPSSVGQVWASWGRSEHWGGRRAS